MHNAPTPLITPTAGAGADQLQRLVELNLRSIQLAKQLLMAQERVKTCQEQAEAAIDNAATTGEPEDIDAAVELVAATEAAEREEDELASRWSRHCVAVYALAEQVSGPPALTP